MFTHKSSFALFVLVLGLAAFTSGQALTPAEVKDPASRALQEKYYAQLKTVGAEVQGHVFPYSFYFSRVLDLELADQQKADQRSLRFDRYGGMTVVELTGNYFASYSSELVSRDQRVLRTFQDVMLPIIEIAMPELKDLPEVQGFAMEISHHVRGKAMGLKMERPENLVLVLPKAAAIRMANAKSETDRQAAILDSHFFLNGEPYTLYLSDSAAQEGALHPPPPPAQFPKESAKRSKSKKDGGAAVATTPDSVVAPAIAAPEATMPMRDTSPEALARIQADYQKIMELVVKETETQAHYVAYAPPAVVAFRKGAYIEFSVNTTLPAATTGSHYKLAALAFDEHISHLIRPVMTYFKGDLNFDGIAFSTTIHQAEPAVSAQGNQAVEFFFPVSALRCYEAFDCTGQQLIDAGSVLMNGERVSLDLQTAEAGAK